MLTDIQKTTLATALKAETDANVVAAMAIRNDVFLCGWCNASSAQNAWQNQMTSRDLFEAMDVTLFDGLTAGKRDAWRLLLDYAPIDMAKFANRKAVIDVWGTTNAVAVLNACTRKATNGEVYLGGTSATSQTVTALKLNYTGMIGLTEMSQALNANP